MARSLRAYSGTSLEDLTDNSIDEILANMDEELKECIKSPIQLANLATSNLTRQFMFCDVILPAAELDSLYRFIQTVADENHKYIVRFVHEYNEETKQTSSAVVQGPVIRLLTDLLKLYMEPVSVVLTCLKFIHIFIAIEDNRDKILECHTTGVILGTMSSHPTDRQVLLECFKILEELASNIPWQSGMKALVREAAVEIILQSISNFPDDEGIILHACFTITNATITLKKLVTETSYSDFQIFALHGDAFEFNRVRCTPIVLDIKERFKSSDLIQNECQRFLDLFPEDEDNSLMDDSIARLHRFEPQKRDIIEEAGASDDDILDEIEDEIAGEKQGQIDIIETVEEPLNEDLKGDEEIQDEIADSILAESIQPSSTINGASGNESLFVRTRAMEGSGLIVTVRKIAPLNDPKPPNGNLTRIPDSPQDANSGQKLEIEDLDVAVEDTEKEDSCTPDCPMITIGDESGHTSSNELTPVHEAHVVDNFSDANPISVKSDNSTSSSGSLKAQACDRNKIRRSTYLVPKSEEQISLLPSVNGYTAPDNTADTAPEGEDIVISPEELKTPIVHATFEYHSDDHSRDPDDTHYYTAESDEQDRSNKIEALSEALHEAFSHDSLEKSPFVVAHTPDDVSDIPSCNDAASLDEDSYSLSDCCSDEHADTPDSVEFTMPGRSISCPGLDVYYRSFDDEAGGDDLSEEDEYDDECDEDDYVDGDLPPSTSRRRRDRRAWGSIHPPNVENLLKNRTPSMVAENLETDAIRFRQLHLPPSHSDPNICASLERKGWDPMPLHELQYLEEKSLESRSISEVSSGTSEPDEEGIIDYLMSQPHGYMVQLLVCRTQVLLYCLSFWNRKRYLTVIDILGRPVVRVLDAVRLPAEIADFARSRQSETVLTAFVSILRQLAKISGPMKSKMVQKLLAAGEKLLVQPIPPSLTIVVCVSMEGIFKQWKDPDKRSMQSMVMTVNKMQHRDDLQDECRMSLCQLLAILEQYCEK